MFIAGLVLAMVYYGGVGMTYSMARKMGRGRFSSFMQGIGWPMDLGAGLSLMFYDMWLRSEARLKSINTEEKE